jgi:hypothetical protein
MHACGSSTGCCGLCLAMHIAGRCRRCDCLRHRFCLHQCFACTHLLCPPHQPGYAYKAPHILRVRLSATAAGLVYTDVAQVTWRPRPSSRAGFVGSPAAPDGPNKLGSGWEVQSAGRGQWADEPAAAGERSASKQGGLAGTSWR